MARPRTRQYAAVLNSSLDSRLLNEVSEGAELLYRRLLHVVDDFGCYLADPVLIRRFVFGRRERVTAGMISRRLAELATPPKWAKRSLVVLYEVDGERLLQICKHFNPLSGDYKPQALYPQPVSNTNGQDGRDSVPNPAGPVPDRYSTRTRTRPEQTPEPTPAITPEPEPERVADDAQGQHLAASGQPPNASGVTDPEDIWALALEKKKAGQPIDKGTTRQTWLKSFAHMFHIRANTADGAGTVTTLTDLFESLWYLEPEAERISRLCEALNIARSKLGGKLHNPMGAAIAAIKKRHDLPLKRERSRT